MHECGIRLLMRVSQNVPLFVLFLPFNIMLCIQILWKLLMCLLCWPVIVMCLYLEFKQLSMIKIDSYFVQRSVNSVAISCCSVSTYSYSICIFGLFAYRPGNIAFNDAHLPLAPTFNSAKMSHYFYWRWQLLFISTWKFLTLFLLSLPTQTCWVTWF